MSRATDLIREEHRHLQPHLEHILTLADAIQPGSDQALTDRIGNVLAFLTTHLLDHAKAEERILYPAVAKALGDPQSTATMTRDHVEVGRLIDILRKVRSELRPPRINELEARSLRRALYGLYAILRLHFAKEEEVYFPILESRQTAAESEALAKALEHH
jgi:iron-sulfur cluster repair protein YtfE (RIC family)